MTERAASQNRQQVGTLPRPIDDALLELRSIRRDDLSIFAAVQDATEDPHNIEDVAPRLAQVELAVENGREAAVINHLQEVEQADLQALLVILQLPAIPRNVISVRHYLLVLEQLRGVLLEEVSPGMSHAQEYARILVRLARVMVNVSQQEYESAHPAHRDFPLHYEGLVEVIESMVPGFLCPLDYGECLIRLHKDLAATNSSLMRVGQDGAHVVRVDGVYVVRDRDDYARLLRALARYVLRFV